MKYHGVYKTTTGKQGKVTCEASYPVGNVKTWCWLTGWYFGGACWAYLVFPNTEQQIMIENDSEFQVSKHIDEEITQLNQIYVERTSWEQKEQVCKFN